MLHTNRSRVCTGHNQHSISVLIMPASCIPHMILVVTKIGHLGPRIDHMKACRCFAVRMRTVVTQYFVFTHAYLVSMLVTSLHHEIKSYAPEPCSHFDSTVLADQPGHITATDTGVILASYVYVPVGIILQCTPYDY